MAHVVVAAGQDLEGMTVQMEGMFAGVVIVDDYVYDVSFLKNEGIRIGTVYRRIHRRPSCAERTIERGDFGCNICDFVEECAVRMSIGVGMLDE